MLNIKRFLLFFVVLYQQKYIIGQLVKRDFQNKYLASYIGLPWAFIQPIMSILVIWFAMTYGLKVGKMETGLSFTVWFICGMIPWLFIGESITSSSNSLIEYSYLIKKTAFKVAIIPFIKIFTTLIIHLFFIVFLAVFAIAYGFYPNIYWIQIIYLLLATFILLTGIGWLTSSINVFVRDVGQVVNVAISILFWATPIMWPYTMLHGNMKYMALFNPFFYIIEGYRYAFLNKMWIFQNVEMTIYFWIFTLTIFFVGALVFKKLTPHFADVL
ncbi:MAG: teichoic acid ABC transporter permease [Bacteroidetes bacterium GWF2_41_31]|nr:MAG: teichoic acid ABC transporter permease [Bacteroidetes bacterium GWF2_41_31]OFZ08156.1 MAG: teichoic acid ABC transporter permease [Bacteroidetes bacterium RIFOXYB12_FULL_41_6]